MIRETGGGFLLFVSVVFGAFWLDPMLWDEKDSSEIEWTYISERVNVSCACILAIFAPKLLIYIRKWRNRNLF